MTNEKTLTLTIDPRALDTLEDMNRQAAAVESVWGTIRPKAVTKTLQTLATQTVRLFNAGFGDASVYRDGDLSLIIQTSSGFVFGMIGHPIDYRVDTPPKGHMTMGITAPRMGLYCMEAVDTPERYCGQPIREGQHTCSHTYSDTVISLPVPMEWGFHS